jgi:hypothetical protein
MDLQDWASATMYALSQYTMVAPLTNGDWQAWGAIFYNSPSLDALNPPNPYDFTDWVSWGQRLSDSLQNSSGAPNSATSSAGTSPTAAFIIAQNGNYLQTQSSNFLATQ